MTTSLRQRFNAAVVFAFCEACALIATCLVNPQVLIRIPELVFGALVAALAAACFAPLLSRLWATAGRAPSLKLFACGACVGLVAVVAMGAAQAWQLDDRWWVESFERVGVPLSWHTWLRLWFAGVWPTAAVLFLVAGAFAARLFGKAACSPTA